MDEVKEKPKLRRLTKKQRDFANAYIDSGNGTQSALIAYDTTSANTAHSIASENLRKPTVREYIESNAQRAAEIVLELANYSEVDAVRLNAAKDIQDRAGFKPVDKSITTNVNIDVAPAPIIQELAHGLLENQRQRLGSSNRVVSEPVGGATADKERSGDTDRVQEEKVPD
jgi:phage terminase small subunit